ncbi:MAG: hypothetical protein ACK5U0_08380 [Gemmatimonas sp.]|uniref:hypothetical protein n=1 Tax=Gemmatimonas sp. TaxID=1962908 RepID=UPI00391ACCD5
MTNAAPWARAVAAAAVAGGCLACGGRGADSGASEGTPGASGVSMQRSSGMPVRTGTTDSTALDGAEGRITSTDGTISLAVLRDTVVMQLSDSLRQGVAWRMDSATSTKAEGVGGVIANMMGSAVKAAVSSAMGVALRAPASQVTDLRYENGHLTFKVDGGSVKFSVKGKRDGSGAPFAPEDAQRFMEAVQAAKARQTAM